MKFAPITTGLLSILMIAGAARAGISTDAVPTHGTAGDAIGFVADAIADSTALDASAVNGLLGMEALLLPDVASPSGADRSPGDVLRIEAPPGSMALFLSGLLTLGAWHAGRSAASWHPQARWMPEWYHTGAPAQVGHATPFDFHASITALSPLDALLVGNSGPRVPVVRRDAEFISQISFLLNDPARGPPS